jgi:hypothetical protein
MRVPIDFCLFLYYTPVGKSRRRLLLQAAVWALLTVIFAPLFNHFSGFLAVCCQPFNTERLPNG